MDPANPQLLVRTLEQAGLFDFERLSLESLPSLCRKVGAWPNGMAQTHLLGLWSLPKLILISRNAKRERNAGKREIGRRTITFSGKASIRALRISTKYSLQRSPTPRLLQAQTGTRAAGRHG